MRHLWVPSIVAARVCTGGFTFMANSTKRSCASSDTPYHSVPIRQRGPVASSYECRTESETTASGRRSFFEFQLVTGNTMNTLVELPELRDVPDVGPPTRESALA